MKFDVWKDTVSSELLFKIPTGSDDIAGSLGGGLKSWKTLRVEGSG